MKQAFSSALKNIFRIMLTILIYFSSLVLLLTVLSFIPSMYMINEDGSKSFSSFAGLLILFVPILLCILLNIKKLKSGSKQCQTPINPLTKSRTSSATIQNQSENSNKNTALQKKTENQVSHNQAKSIHLHTPNIEPMVVSNPRSPNPGAEKKSSNPSPLTTQRFYTFRIPYLNFAGDQHQHATVTFYCDKPSAIYINGAEEYFSSSFIVEDGWDSSKRYRVLHTNHCTFYIQPDDYSRFSQYVFSNRLQYYNSTPRLREERRLLIQQKQERFTPDPVSSECIKCFCVINWSSIEYRVTNGDILISKIEDICKVNGGRMYKTQAKSAKCAILMEPSSRNRKEYERIHNLGYITVTLEDFLTFFGCPELYPQETADSDLRAYLSTL